MVGQGDAQSPQSGNKARVVFENFPIDRLAFGVLAHQTIAVGHVDAPVSRPFLRIGLVAANDFGEDGQLRQFKRRVSPKASYDFTNELNSVFPKKNIYIA